MNVVERRRVHTIAVQRQGSNRVRQIESAEDQRVRGVAEIQDSQLGAVAQEGEDPVSHNCLGHAVRPPAHPFETLFSRMPVAIAATIANKTMVRRREFIEPPEFNWLCSRSFDLEFITRIEEELSFVASSDLEIACFRQLAGGVEQRPDDILEILLRPARGRGR